MITSPAGDRESSQDGTRPRSAAATTLPVRPARDEDAQDLFGLLALCFAEYPGCYVDPHHDLVDLRMSAGSYAGNGGAFWVAEDSRGRVCACLGVDYPSGGAGELHRLYVRPDLRRRSGNRRRCRRRPGHAGPR